MDYNIEDLPENIKNKLQVLGEHWIWMGATGNPGRKDLKGRLRFNGKMEYPHRVIFHLLTGFDLNSELQVNHSRNCQISLCCHPNCLYAGTQLDNMKDKSVLFVHKTHCSTCGSELKISPTNGDKYCQTCKNRRRDEWRKRNK